VGGRSRNRCSWLCSARRPAERPRFLWHWRTLRHSWRDRELRFRRHVREFDIGTAKPTASERARAPHHLLDCVAPTEQVTAGEYARQARQVLEEIKARGHLPIVVGGTGLYLRALLEGPFRAAALGGLRERLRGRAGSRGRTIFTACCAVSIMLRRRNSCQRHPEGDPGDRSLPGFAAKMTELWRQGGREPLRGFRILRLGARSGSSGAV